MNNVDIETVLQYTKELNILYVEDDLEIQKQSKNFLDSIFKSVTAANDGLEALKLYDTNTFDIIITDIIMPNMDGLELSKKIKSIDKNASIIVTSAYNDSDSLIEFINLNIQYFISKPIVMQDMLFKLYIASKNIINSRMVKQYRAELEHTNKELKTKNEELQRVVKILDTKLTQISTKLKNDEEKDFSSAVIDKKHLDELMELENDISGIVVLIGLTNNFNVSNIKALGEICISYAKVLSLYPDYNELGSSIEKLGRSLIGNPNNFIQNIERVFILIDSFIYILHMWRTNLLQNRINKAFVLQASIIYDINTMVDIAKAK